MSHESQKSISIDDLVRQKSEAGNTPADALFSGPSRVPKPNLDGAQNVLDNHVDRGGQLKIDGTVQLALGDGPGGKTASDQNSKSATDELKKLEELKAFDNERRGKFRDPPNPNVPMLTRDDRMFIIPQYPSRPSIPGQPIDRSRLPETKPRVNTDAIERERKALPKHFSADKAKEAKDTAKRLGLPLAVQVNVDSQLEEDNPRYKQSVHGVFDQLETSLHGKAVFLYISAGDGSTPQDREQRAEAQQELKKAKEIAKSIGIEHFGTGNQQPDRRRPFGPPPMVKGVPHIAIFDASGNKTYDQHVNKITVKNLNDKILGH